MIIKFNADSTFVPSNASEFRSKEVLERWRSTLPGTYDNVHVPVSCFHASTGVVGKKY